MSDLTTLLEKLAGRTRDAEVSEEVAAGSTDYVFVEKLASAVDQILDGGLLLKLSAEDEEKPMDREEGKEKEEGTEDDKKSSSRKERLKKLLAAKRAKGDEVADDTSEKDEPGEDESQAKESSDTAAISSAVANLKEQLLAKVASRKEGGGERSQILDNLLSRIQGEAPVEEEAEVEKEAATEPEDLDDPQVESTVVDEETKEASEWGLTLASMLDHAQGGAADDASESTASGVKTAASQDVDVSSLLRESLLARARNTEDK